MENQEKFEAIADFDGNLMKTQSENEEENTEILYLNFKKGEKLVLVAAYENGWNYGFLERKPEEYGFFPSNYVKKFIDTSDDTKETKVENDKPASPQKENPLKRKSENNWMDFVQGILSNEPEKNDTQDPTAKKEISENDILNEALVQNNYNSIIGYKKIKITNDPSQPLKKRPQFNIGNNPAPVLNNEFAMIPVKQQDPNSKAIRLLYHYFDYEKWIEEKNSGKHQKKAKPDATKKKPKKKILNLKL